VDVRIAGVALASWIVGYIPLLSFKIVFIPNAMFVASRVPDLAWKLFADGERISSLNKLDAACCALIDGRCDEDMNVVWHDREGVERESALVPVAEQGGNHELGVRGALEDSVSLVGEDGNGVGTQFLADGSHEREHTPGAKALSPPGWREGQA
jgi:hypothetical protein